TREPPKVAHDREAWRSLSQIEDRKRALEERCNLAQLRNRRRVFVRRVFPNGKPGLINLETICGLRWRKARGLPRPCQERRINRRFHASGHDAATFPATRLPQNR